MKKIITFLFVFYATLSFSQITLEHRYVERAWYAQISATEWNYYTWDASHINIYDINHNLIRTFNTPSIGGYNVFTPGSAAGPPPVIFVSKTLFNTDTSYEFAVLYGQVSKPVLLTVYTESGTRLLYDTIGSNGTCIYPVIINTNAGMKLVVSLYTTGFTGTKVYSLGGNFFPSAIEEYTGNSNTNPLPYPNPATNVIHLPYRLPNGATKAEMVIMNNNGQTVGIFNVGNAFNDLLINTDKYPVGIYYYFIHTDTYQSETNKFIISK